VIIDESDGFLIFGRLSVASVVPANSFFEKRGMELPTPRTNRNKKEKSERTV
jgi:hypothetical protein